MSILPYILLFFIPVLTGFSVYFIDRSFYDKYLDYIKLFGASFFLGVIVMHLLPEVFDHAPKEVGLFVALGFFVQVMLESFTGSDPHDHLVPDKLGKYSVALLIGLGIHAFFEGFPLSNPYHDLHGHHVGDTYLAGVLLHKIPVISILVLMMLGSGLSKRKISIQIVLFSGMTPLGMAIGEIIRPGTSWSVYILAFVVGSISHIAMHLVVTKDMSAGGSKSIILKVVMMVVGFLVVYFL